MQNAMKKMVRTSLPPASATEQPAQPTEPILPSLILLGLFTLLQNGDTEVSPPAYMMIPMKARFRLTAGWTSRKVIPESLDVRNRNLAAVSTGRLD